MVEEAIADHYPDQEIRCPVHLSIGQEAVPVGVSVAIPNESLFFSNHRSHGHYLAKGGHLNRMIAEIYGKETGCCRGRGGSMHLIDISCGYMGSVPIVGSIIPIATGAAFSMRLKGEEGLVVVFFGDGAVEEGAFYESLNFALLHNLQLLYVCENNLYSVYSPLSVRQPPGREIFSLAQGIGLPAFQGDGNDVEDVILKSAMAVDIIRTEKSPVFMEFKTYRWREHCGPNYDNDIGYRMTEEFDEWRNDCPVSSYAEKLLCEGLLLDSDIRCMKEKIQTEINQAFTYAKNSPFPDKEDLSDEVYA
ncbi:thiamine pyrophosphate-dependent dehydrogenase E1 component subunit alpha [Methanospirillum sp.]